MMTIKFAKFCFQSKPNKAGSFLFEAVLLCVFLAFLLCFASPSLSAQASNKTKAKTVNRPQKYSGLASWYSMKDRHVKKYTANGEIFNDKHTTCATRNYKFGTRLKVVNAKNGKSVVCRVNDRGPSHKYKKRVVDLTKSAFQKIADTRQGLIPVSVIPVEA